MSRYKMRKLLILLVIFIAVSTSSVFAGELFDMDFSENVQQVRVLNEHEGVVLLNKDVEWGVIIINRVHGQKVDLEVFSSDSGKLVSINTLNAVDEVLQVDLNKDHLADFVIDVQAPVKDDEVFLIVKKLFEDAETAIIDDDAFEHITGSATVESSKKPKLGGFLITSLLMVIGLAGYYMYTKKKK